MYDIFLQNSRFLRVIYGCFKMAIIWHSETGMRFLEAYIGVWKRLHMSVSKLSYTSVLKRPSYDLVKQVWRH